jgi:hypothetical protein
METVGLENGIGFEISDNPPPNQIRNASPPRAQAFE